jgi:hypothetical protein
MIQGCLLRTQKCLVGRSHEVSSKVPARTRYRAVSTSTAAWSGSRGLGFSSGRDGCADRPITGGGRAKGYRTGLGARRLARCPRHVPAHRDGSAGDGFDAQRHRAWLSDGPDRGYPSRQWLSASGTRIPRGCFDGKEIMRSSNRRRLERNRKFVDSPLEGNGFELPVPRRRNGGPLTRDAEIGETAAVRRVTWLQAIRTTGL